MGDAVVVSEGPTVEVRFSKAEPRPSATSKHWHRSKVNGWAGFRFMYQLSHIMLRNISECGASISSLHSFFVSCEFLVFAVTITVVFAVAGDIPPVHAAVWFKLKKRVTM